MDGVSLSVAEGEFVVVRGPSGSGKTTLLLVAGGLLAPTEGRVVIDGDEAYALSPEARARLRAAKIGFVFQQFHLVPYLGVLENVMVAWLAAGHGHPAAAVRERADELLDRFSLSERAAHLPGELSTGERQRVALARALLNRPTYILADEPTGNLDPDNAENVLHHIGEFARAGGAVLLVTHHDVSQDHPTRVLSMRGGRVG